MSDISGIKAQVSEALRAKNSGGAIAQSSSGSSDVTTLIKVVAGSAVVVGGLAWLLAAAFSPKEVVKPADTGNAQIDQAMQMLQEQQDINRKLLEGQQELNAQMIEAQSKHKPVSPNVFCFLANCAGADGTEGQPDQQYAIVGEGIRTARINPERFQIPTQPQQPAQPQQLPVQAVDYSAPTGDAQFYDQWQAHYADMQARFPEMSSTQWSQCSADWSQQPTPQMNCAALGVYLKRVYGG